MRLRRDLVEEHLSYMDQFDSKMIARGPTFTSDGTMTGSVHVVELPNPAAARAFAFDEPYYQAGVYRDVLLRRWRNVLGTTMWEFDAGEVGNNRYLVLGFTSKPAADKIAAPTCDNLIAFGPLLSDDGAVELGVAALLEASDADMARNIVSTDGLTGVEVHEWRFGGRSN